MNITKPNVNSDIQKAFEEEIECKIQTAISRLSKIEYVRDKYVDNHLYRLYIPCKDLLMDFEWYPVINPNFNYVRINYNTNIENVIERLFPETIIDTQYLNIWKLNQRASNRFLRDNNISPIYNKNVLRLALVGDDMTIYQCVVISDNKIIANVVRKNCSVPYGTLILLRYLNEMFGYNEILIKDNLDDSYKTTLYQILNLPIVSKTCKKKIWWSPNKTKWHISSSERNAYMSYYFTENITYSYPARDFHT